jgi:hypothetical protein
MFDSGNWDERVDQLEAAVIARQAQISQLWAQQVADLRDLDRYQIDTADGARTMGDWVSSHLDLSHQTSSRLMTVVRADDPEIDAALESGTWGLDRAALLVRLRQAGAAPKLFSEAAGKYSLGRLYGLIDRLRHLSPADEQDLFEYRYLVVQPSLDQSAFKLWGHLPSSTGREARGRGLGEQTSRTGGGCQTRPKRPPQLHHPPPSRRHPLPPASLTRRQEPSPRLRRGDKRRSTSPGPWPVEEVAEVFVDANLAAESFGETGFFGPRGPKTTTGPPAQPANL